MRTLSQLNSLKSISLKNNRLVSTLEFLFSLPYLATCDLSFNSIQVSYLDFIFSHVLASKYFAFLEPDDFEYFS